MTYPLISVIIPAYNHESYIQQCLNSILKENYPNKEIVIINDGSKDNTQHKIEEWIKENRHLIPVTYKNRENCGIAKTFNELIDMSKGEFIVFLASDDYLINNGITKRYEWLINHPTKMAVIGDCIVVDQNDNILYESGISGLHKGNKSKLKTDKDMKDEIITNYSIPGSLPLMKKEIFSIIGKFDETSKIEDWEFYLKIVLKNLLVFLDEKVTAYRVHVTNTCRTKENWPIIQSYMATISQKYFWQFTLYQKLFVLWRYIVRPSLAKIAKRMLIIKTK